MTALTTKTEAAKPCGAVVRVTIHSGRPTVSAQPYRNMTESSAT